MTAARLLLALILLSCTAARAQTEDPTDQPWPVPIYIAVRVLDVSRIQENVGEMAANVEVTARWRDSRVGFDPSRIGSGYREFTGRAATQELDRIWNPGLTIRNLAGTPRLDEPGLIISSTGEVTLVRTLEANFRIPIDMSRFPFDRLQLPIEITSSRHPDHRLVFTHAPRDDVASTANPNPRASAWRLGSVSFENTRHVAWNGDDRSVLIARAEAVRYTGQFLSRIFVPFFMVMMSSLFVLWSPDTNYFPKGTMIFSAILALVALSFTLENSFPGSISMQTPVSTIMTSGFVYLVLALILNILAMNPEARWAKRHFFVAAEVRGVIKWAVPLLMVVIWTSLLVQAVI